MLTRQEIFTKVVTHLRKQGDKAMGRDPLDPEMPAGCMYRGENGTMCAVGCLIRDEVYTSDIEGYGVCNIGGGYLGEDHEAGRAYQTLANALYESGVDVYEDRSLLEALQKLHDREQTSDWELGFKAIAEVFELELPVLA